MSPYSLSALIAFVLLGMGTMAFVFGARTYKENKKSNSGRKMFGICICVFFWNFGYAWMSLCHGDDFAYVPRAIALLSVAMYMFCVLDYVVYLSHFPRVKFIIFSILFGIASVIAWLFIIQKDAVTFQPTAWGYWYTSKITWARILQFVSIIAALIMFYVILAYWRKRTINKRNRYIVNCFNYFGIILFVGYLFDTLFPTIFNTAAIPGSSIAAFFSALLLYFISRSNQAFGLSVNNVSEYVFRDVTTPVLVFNWQGELELFNSQTSVFFNLEQQELLGSTQDNLFWKTEINDIYQIKDRDILCKLQRTDVYDQFEELLYSIVFVQDVTDEQNAIRLMFDSREEAQAANQAKSNFLANMSHEIRTPMNAIVGMSDIVLRDESLSEDTKNQIYDIKSAGLSLLEIINDILDISKIEAGKYELIEDKYDLPSVINDLSNIISVRTSESKIDFRLSVSPDIPSGLIGDHTRVRQILMNLLGNSVKFTKQGYVKLTAFWNGDKEDPVLCFDIEDTGIGIKEEDISTIFGAFNQVDTRKNRNVQGTGLGLAISKQLAQMMGGDIVVKSTYGKGSIFSVEIHQKVDEFQPIGEQIAKSLEDKNFKQNSNEKKIKVQPKPHANILIVDDNMVNLKVAEGLMRPYQMQVDTAKSGREAIEKVQLKDYDIVFMDHMMPDLDGVDTTKIIRELEDGKYKELVIIALSANALNDAKEMFLREGMQDFISKPINPKELNRILDKWL